MTLSISTVTKGLRPSKPQGTSADENVLPLDGEMACTGDYLYPNSIPAYTLAPMGKNAQSYQVQVIFQPLHKKITKEKHCHTLVL